MTLAATPARRLSGWAVGALAVGATLLVFELLARFEVFPSRWFPPPSQIFAALLVEVVTPEFWSAVWATLRGWAAGLAIAAMVGIPVGMLVGSSPFLYRQVRVLIEFFRPIPSVALIPVAVMLFGTRFGGKVFLAAFASLWPLLFQSMYGVQDVDPVAADTARAYRIAALRRAWRVTLPSAAPYVATGLRISSSISLILVVTAELIIGSAGIGREIGLAQSGAATDITYAYIAVAGVLGLVLNSVFSGVERRVLHWHPSQREEAAQ